MVSICQIEINYHPLLNSCEILTFIYLYLYDLMLSIGQNEHALKSEMKYLSIRHILRLRQMCLIIDNTLKHLPDGYSES